MSTQTTERTVGPTQTGEILLIPPPYLRPHGIQECTPLGLCSLQAAAGSIGARVDVFDYATVFGEDEPIPSSEEFAARVAAGIQVDRYAAIGLSTVCSGFHHSLNIARLLCRSRPDVRLWLGGPHVSVHPRRALEAYPWIEAVFVGEAETSFVRALERVSRDPGARLDGLPGVCTRSAPFLAQEPIDDLDDLPYLDASPAYGTSLVRRLETGELRALPIEAARGCPGRCSFCSTSRFWGKRTRRKSAERISSEMHRVQELTGSSYFSLVADNFAHPRDSLREFCRTMARLSPGHEWECSLKLDRLTVADLPILWEGGCRGFYVGVESASQQTLDRVHKDVDLARQLGVIDAAIERGFLVFLSFMIGFPWETAKEREETYRLHVDLMSKGACCSDMLVLSPYPGTEIQAEYQGQVVHGEGISFGPADYVSFGEETRELMDRCPELFTQFDYIPTGSSKTDLRATVLAARTMANFYGARRYRV
jgi:anaerobic magnesium-protoporphyrin IX monomethyl ester cyclase